MNYKKVYNDLIEKRTKFPLIKNGDGRIETHHIIPKSYGGTNEKQNKINLTLREHFVAHLLLYHEAKKIGNQKNAASMAVALMRMMTSRNRFNSHVYEFLKSKNDFAYFWKGRKHKKETREKTRKTMTPENSNNPRIWICKNGVVKYVRKIDLQSFLDEGFELGRRGYKPRRGC